MPLRFPGPGLAVTMQKPDSSFQNTLKELIVGLWLVSWLYSWQGLTSSSLHTCLPQCQVLAASTASITTQLPREEDCTVHLPLSPTISYRLPGEWIQINIQSLNCQNSNRSCHLHVKNVFCIFKVDQIYVFYEFALVQTFWNLQWYLDWQLVGRTKFSHVNRPAGNPSIATLIQKRVGSGFKRFLKTY